MSSVELKFKPSSSGENVGTLYIQVSHKRVVRQIVTDYKIHSNEWNMTQSTFADSSIEGCSSRLMEIRENIKWDMDYLNRIILQRQYMGVSYEVDDVVARFVYVREHYTLYKYMETIISQLQTAGKNRTCETYRAALSSFKSFRKGEDIMLYAITPRVILLYEKFLKSQGLRPNTTSFYMRILRAVYNRAVEAGVIEQRNPFKQVYTGVSKTVKRSISTQDIKRMKQLILKKESMVVARDIFLFSFYNSPLFFLGSMHSRRPRKTAVPDNS
jgi:hypothetical protein